ncbi:MAG: helix-turn-helix domain-containing protein [Eubacterium sp.]|nr:helix-turn-helix domain-containing protein [Eubacterium sp.]
MQPINSLVKCVYIFIIPSKENCSDGKQIANRENIIEVRLEKGLSQEKLSNMCGFSNTVLSAYENAKRYPGLDTTVIIAQKLGVSIERLYYGDDNNAFISATPDMGRKIVNAIFFLWDSGVITGCQKYNTNKIGSSIINDGMINDTILGPVIRISKHADSINRLIKQLNDFKCNKGTFDNPKEYLEMILSSVAKEINNNSEE